MTSSPEKPPLERTYRIRRSQHLGYGFIAGHEQPTMVKIIEPNGPSFQRLIPGDVIMAVNGIDVENATREQIIKMIQLSQDEINIKVRQPTYEEILRVKNLADPKMYMSKTVQHPTTSSSKLQNYMPLDRIVTSISQQNAQTPFTNGNNRDINQVQAPQNEKTVLKQRSDNNDTMKPNNLFHGATTLGRNNHSNINPNKNKYGRHSPVPQRCKSSMSGTQVGKLGKLSADDDNDQPMLKRSNTMRPIRPPAKVMEIFEVVIRIFFEDGHTRVLNYNQDTTVGAILETLNARLVSNSPNCQEIKQYFGLTLTVNSEESSREQQMGKRKLLHILDENDSIMKIRQLPYAPKLRLLYRMIYPPADISKLYSLDKVAFDYLYKQSCNDLRLERFSPQLEADTAFKLAALHLVEYVYSNHPRAHGNSRDPKVYMKLIKKTPGLQHFVPMSVVEGTAEKKSRKNLVNYKRLKTRLMEQLKSNFDEFDFEPPKVKSTTNLNKYTSTSFHELALPEFQSSPSDYVKLLFLSFLCQLPCYKAAKKPIRASTSPIDRSSIGDCSSSMDSVPRTSDSSPLIKREQGHSMQNEVHNRIENIGSHTISRFAHINSMRSLSSSTQPQSSQNGQLNDQVDMAQTPSIESISSITFNLQNSPSPQLTSSRTSQQSVFYPMAINAKPPMIEPSPMPRQQTSHMMRTQYSGNSIDEVYIQRFVPRVKPLDELLKNAILLPPPPASAILFGGFTSNKMSLVPITPILTDRDLEGLKVPPPPPRIEGNHRVID